MTESLPPGPEETDAAMKPVQDELFRALFSHARANGDLRADVTVIALVDFAAQMAIASGMLWQDYPAPAHSSFSAALYDFANQLEAHRGARARSANDCDIARDAEPAEHVLERDPQHLQWLTRQDWFRAKIPRATPNHHQLRAEAERVVLPILYGALGTWWVFIVYQIVPAIRCRARTAPHEHPQALKPHQGSP